jgi:hypothetical protein
MLDSPAAVRGPDGQAHDAAQQAEAGGAVALQPWNPPGGETSAQFV